MSAQRRETAWQSLAEHRIQKAQAAGEFDNLPGFGKPFDDLGDPDDTLWWLRRKLRRERLSALPPALQIRAELHRTLEYIESLSDESQVRAQLQQLNQKIRQANRAIVWGPPSDVMPLDVDATVARWKRQRAASRDDPIKNREGGIR